MGRREMCFSQLVYMIGVVMYTEGGGIGWLQRFVRRLSSVRVSS